MNESDDTAAPTGNEDERLPDVMVRAHEVRAKAEATHVVTGYNIDAGHTDHLYPPAAPHAAIVRTRYYRASSSSDALSCCLGVDVLSLPSRPYVPYVGSFATTLEDNEANLNRVGNNPHVDTTHAETTRESGWHPRYYHAEGVASHTQRQRDRRTNRRFTAACIVAVMALIGLIIYSNFIYEETLEQKLERFCRDYADVVSTPVAELNRALVQLKQQCPPR